MINRQATSSILHENTHRLVLLTICTITLLTSVIFGQLISAEFVSIDDKINITENKCIQELSIVNLKEIWTKVYRGMYIPVTYTVWALIAAASRLLFFGETVSGVFHLFNIVIHGINVVFVFFISSLYLQLTAPDISHEKRLFAAALGSLFFALHPIQIEAVAWVTGLKDLLSGFFSFATILLLFRIYTRSDIDFLKTFRQSLFVFPVFLAALLAKPSAVITPFFVLVMVISIYPKGYKKYLLLQLPFLALSLAVVLITKSVQPVTQTSTVLYDFYLSPLIAIDSLFFYIRKLFWPDFFILDYGRTVPFVLAQPLILFIMLGFAGAGILYFLAARKQLVPALLFIIGVSPVLGFIPFWFQRISTVSDRYIYLAMIGTSLFIAGLFTHSKSRAAMLVLILVLLLLGYKSLHQITYWHSSYHLMGHTLAYNPTSPVANLNYGIALMKRGDYQSAITYTNKAAQLTPNDPNTYYNLGLSYIFANNLEKAQTQHNILLSLAPEKAHRLKQAMKKIPERLNNLRQSARNKQPD